MPLLRFLKLKCKTDTLVDIKKDQSYVPYLDVTYENYNREKCHMRGLMQVSSLIHSMLGHKNFLVINSLIVRRFPFIVLNSVINTVD